MRVKTILVSLCATFLAACTAAPEGVEPVTGFEVDRYLGKWYEIARADHSFERGLSNVTADYARNEDGTISVLNKGLKTESCEWQSADGVAEFLGPPDIASLKVTFFWPFSGGYHVFALDRENYSYALVAGPSFEYFWLLSRTPTLEAELQARLLEKAKAVGFKTDDLIFVSQDPANCT